MSDLETAARQCPACNEAGEAAVRLPRLDFESWKLGCCRNCGFVFLLNPPETGSLVDEYAFEKTFTQRKVLRRSALRDAAAWIRSLLARFKRAGPNSVNRIFPSGKVLDVGCGAGERLEPPVTPYGIEISRALFEVADKNMRSRGGYCVHASGSEGIAQFDANQFDGVLMNSYLEHEVDVLPVLRGAHRCLKQNGRLFLRVPNFASVNQRFLGRSWCGFRYPDHVNYFTPKSLGYVAAKAGFQVRILNRIRLPIDDNIHALLTKAR